MNDFKPITNNLRKVIISLKDKKSREQEKMFIIEGEKLCRELLLSDVLCELVVIRSTSKEETLELAEEFENRGVAVYVSRSAQFDNLCDTKSPQDIIAIAKIQETNLILNESYIALDGVNDPGNLGTIIRTADWFGFKNIILGNNSVDRFNPKTVRSTMGSLFRLNIINAENLADFIENNSGIKTYGASLQGRKLLSEIRPPEKCGLIFGSEAWGISKEVIKVINEPFKIEGFGSAESLNVAVSVGVTLYHFSNKK